MHWNKNLSLYYLEEQCYIRVILCSALLYNSPEIWTRHWCWNHMTSETELIQGYNLQWIHRTDASNWTHAYGSALGTKATKITAAAKSHSKDESHFLQDHVCFTLQRFTLTIINRGRMRLAPVTPVTRATQSFAAHLNFVRNTWILYHNCCPWLKDRPKHLRRTNKSVNL